MVSEVRGQTVQFTKQDILVILPIESTPPDEPSFNDVVACTPSISQASKELCQNLSDYGFSMKSRLLKKELILVFLFCEYNIALSSNTTEVYSKDTVLCTWIMSGIPFDVAKIMYLAVL